ncbi:YlzJ-like protein [Bacillus sp. 491mf]|uniref:YlzJ-like family protein n=1 Tax=Bacillus TaxID=1386 RepID=UPI000558BA64|nr:MULTISPECIES: YlzJ-like family protein [unclassified Bacillus (in: firmicutes)]SFB98519.1 YlzJ-like protein [Bacillus sp. 491mf]
MILYTIMPEQLVYPIDHAEFAKQKIIHVDGIDMVVEMGNENNYSVIRVLSTNPEHFLQYEPGQKISFS